MTGGAAADIPDQHGHTGTAEAGTVDLARGISVLAHRTDSAAREAGLWSAASTSRPGAGRGNI